MGVGAGGANFKTILYTREMLSACETTGFIAWGTGGHNLQATGPPGEFLTGLYKWRHLCFWYYHGQCALQNMQEESLLPGLCRLSQVCGGACDLNTRGWAFSEAGSGEFTVGPLRFITSALHSSS